MARKIFSMASRPLTTASPSPPKTASARRSPKPAKSPPSTSSAYRAMRFSMHRALWCGSGAATPLTVSPRSTGKAHQFDADPVGVGAIDEVEHGLRRTHGGAGVAQDRPAQRLDHPTHDVEILDPQRQ